MVRERVNKNEIFEKSDSLEFPFVTIDNDLLSHRFSCKIK